MPTSMIVGKDGNILFIGANFYWASPELIEIALGSAFAALADTLPPEIDLGGGSGGDLVPETQICRKALCPLEDLTRR